MLKQHSSPRPTRASNKTVGRDDRHYAAVAPTVHALDHTRHFPLVELGEPFARRFTAEEAAENPHAGRGIADRVVAEIDEDDRNSGSFQAAHHLLRGFPRAVSGDPKNGCVGPQHDGRFQADALFSGLAESGQRSQVRKGRGVAVESGRVQPLEFIEQPGHAGYGI